MAIDFPASPAVGQRYAYAGISYVFTAQGVWSIIGTNVAPAVSTSKVTIQKFTTSGTYVPTPGTQFAIVECIGAGGGGGYGNTDATSSLQGGGGGGGGYSRSVLTAAQIGVAQPITIGAGGVGNDGSGYGQAGGATSFGAFCVANGGNGGGFAQSGATVPYGGVGAAPGTGDIAVGGSPGGWGQYSLGTNVFLCGGDGGVGPLGGGATTPGLGNFGVNGVGYGSGGSGGNGHYDGSSKYGGNGASGIVIVTEFNIAAAGPQGPAGPMGGTTGVSLPGGRLTLSATDPVMQGTIVQATTIYYLPYVGDRIPIFDGANMVMTTIPAGLSTTTTDTTKNPGALNTASMVDWFVWNDGGTIRLCHGPDWSNDRTRSAGTVIVRIGGIWTNSAPITNGPGPNRGTYVGSTKCAGDAKLYWRPNGASTVGGEAALPMVFNAYNRVPIVATASEAASSWTYEGTSFRPINGSNNNRIYWVAGLPEVWVSATYSSLCQSSGSTGPHQLMASPDPSLPVFSRNFAYMNFTVGQQITGEASCAIGPHLGMGYVEAQEAGGLTGYGSGFMIFYATMTM